jgi:putative SOS response-associated peptidase YedK
MTEYQHAEKPPKWITVRCISSLCGHGRAVPLAPWRIRWGQEDVAPLMARRFRCGVCGRPGCSFDQKPRDLVGVAGAERFEPIFFPAGRELAICGERQVGESYIERDRRVSAGYLERYPAGDAIRTVDCMCNLYSITKGPQAIRQLLGTVHDLTNGFAPIPAVFPNRMAPVVRCGPDGELELLMMRWGFPPPNIPGSKPSNPYLTNVRNTDSKYWQTYLKKPEQRCLVPVTSFAEPDNNQGPKSIWTWFAQDETRPLMFFAGIWREWEGDRGTKVVPDVGKHLVFSFLTTKASPDVAPIYPDATPVLLRDVEARDEWMAAPWELARDRQRSPPAGVLKIVSRDTKQDA